MPKKSRPQVAVVMGSSSDWEVMQHCVRVLEEFSISCHCQVLSAHRMPHAMLRFAEGAEEVGLQIIIAGAGGAAHLPGMLASMTLLPVLGVPIPSRHLQGLDSLLSIVQMPSGIAVPTLAIGEAGAVNAALAAVGILALHNPALKKKLAAYRARQTQQAAGTRLR